MPRKGEDDLGLVLRATKFAAHKHKDQRRKDAEASPYINHPIALADVLANEGRVTDVEVLCAAILHDTIEDTSTTADELTESFGPEAAAIVLEVTDDKTLEKDVRKRLQIEHATHLSPRAKLVKLADKICNLRDVLASPPNGWSLERKREYFDWAASVIAGVRGVHPLLRPSSMRYRRGGMNWRAQAAMFVGYRGSQHEGSNPNRCGIGIRIEVAEPSREGRA